MNNTNTNTNTATATTGKLRDPFGPDKFVVVLADGKLLKHEDNYGHDQITYFRSDAAAARRADEINTASDRQNLRELAEEMDSASLARSIRNLRDLDSEISTLAVAIFENTLRGRDDAESIALAVDINR